MQDVLKALDSIRIDTATNKGSVIDVVRAICGGSSSYASEIILNITNVDMELGGKITHVNINNKGKPTPVADAVTLMELVWVLPGKHAKDVRRQCAELLCRVLGGDLDVAEGIKHQHDSIQGTSAQQFLNPVPPPLFPVTNNSLTPIKGVSEDFSMDLCGVYLCRYGPRLQAFSALTEHEQSHLLGYGYTDNFARRRAEHAKRFGGCELLDFVSSCNRDLETQFASRLRLYDRLCKGRVDGESSDVVELFLVKDQEDYEEWYQMLQKLEQMYPHPSVAYREKGIAEAKVKEAEAQARKAEAQARQAEAEGKARQIEAKYKYKIAKLEFKSEKLNSGCKRKSHDPTPEPVILEAPVCTPDPVLDAAREPTPIPVTSSACQQGYVVMQVFRNRFGIRQISLTGEKIRDFKSATEAENETGLYRKKIASACEKNGEYGGYCWASLAEDSTTLEVKLNYAGTWIQRSLSGTFVNSYFSACEVGRVLQVSHTTIMKASVNKKPCLGYLWEHVL